MENNTKAKLVESNGLFIIKKAGGEIVSCPYRAMIMTNNQIQSGNNSVTQSNQVCSSDCAKFETKEKEGRKFIVMSCGTTSAIEFDEIEKSEKKESKLQIKL